MFKIIAIRVLPGCAEYLRWMFTDKQGRHVEGLVYKSCEKKKI